MKDKILILIIGALVGAVITAAGFLIFEKTNQNNNQMLGGERMEMMQRPDGMEPPEKPDGKQKNGNMQPPNFSRDGENMDFSNIDLNNIPEKPAGQL